MLNIVLMKTKLLKHLRRKAKEQYRIKKTSGEYGIYIRKDIGVFDYFYLFSILYNRLSDAKTVCNGLRRKYILDEVERLRAEHGKFINF